MKFVEYGMNAARHNMNVESYVTSDEKLRGAEGA